MDLIDLGKTPIAEKTPCGSDVRYEPDFEALQAEIDKLSSPTAASSVDWDRVVDMAAGILGSKSKDLTTACYLAVALLRTRQVEGLDIGLTVLGDLLETYWDGLFPPKKRMRGRAGAIVWWLERSETELSNVTAASLAADLAERLKANLQRIDAVLSEKMPDAPLLRPLARIVEQLPVQSDTTDTPAAPAQDNSAGARSPARTAAEDAPPAPKPASRRTTPPPAGATDDLSGAIGDAGDARRAADAAFQRLRQVSLFLLQSDAKNQLAYRYRRIAAWAKVAALPPAADGTTQIPAPASQVAAAIQALHTEGRWEAVIQNAEPKVSQYIFWFDLNRWIVEALDRLGEGYAEASLAVCQETSRLLERLPGLADLKFADGTPFADPQTGAWLQGLRPGVAVPAVMMETPATQDGPREDPLQGVLREARAMARKKKLIDAVEMLQQQMQNSISQRQRMRWRLAIAGLLMEMKKVPLALPQLENVLADIDTFRLEAWDPEAALEGLLTAWQAFSAQPGDGYQAKAADLLERIAKIDPAAALRAAK